MEQRPDLPHCAILFQHFVSYRHVDPGLQTGEMRKKSLSEGVNISDLVERKPDFLNPAISFDGSISLKKLTRQVVREVERKVILRALHHHHWHRKQVACTLGISYRALLYKIRDAGLSSSRAPRLRAGSDGVDN
jgi:DNA-binding NtrC family response regulator